MIACEKCYLTLVNAPHLLNKLQKLHGQVNKLSLLLKGAVSRNSPKLGNYKMPVKLIKRNIKITVDNFKGRLK